MEIDEFFKLRNDLLSESKDEEGFLSESNFLECVIPYLVDAKLIDSEDVNDSYYLYQPDKMKINGYSVNESGERLQLFIVNEESIGLDIEESTLQISLKSYYETQFNRVIKFVQKSLKGELMDDLQDADGIKVLATQISSSEGIDQFDVIEIFLISATATIDNRSSTPQPRIIDFEDEKVKVNFNKNRVKTVKEISFKRKLIDLNYLRGIQSSQGNREPLTVDFEKLFDFKIEAIKAADEEYFESYLCVLPGDIISELYKEFSTRMLEKNVRSFLQFPKRGVNSGMKDTITYYPEKFIAFNNGLTITATGKEVVEIDGKFFIKSLTDFQIVNGGQTTATIFFTKKEGISVEKIKVMAKINIAKNSTEEELDRLITEISTFSNAQSRVSKVDLRARSVQLIKIKALSDSVVTPKGYKWFFERAKGELKTAIIKSGNKEKILKKHPKERRFTKEELAKYYSVWGDKPYLVKLGGEKIFREFIEEISGEGSKKKALIINRYFYENLISRVILFRSLEKIYGDGKNKIGNLRAAVIPYSVSIIHKFTDGGDDNLVFDLNKIWINEGLEQDLSEYMYELMFLMNNLIKKYSLSDDYNEYSKSRDLWEKISLCNEIEDFMDSENTKKILSKYSISKDENKKRLLKIAKTIEVDFKGIQDNVAIHANGLEFYKKLRSLSNNLKLEEKELFDSLIAIVFKKVDLSQELIEFEKDLISKVLFETPEILDDMQFKINTVLYDVLDYIVDQYNTCINSQEDIKKTFEKIQINAKNKSIKNYNIWGKIGEMLTIGESPKMSDILTATSLNTNEISIVEPIEKEKIDETLMIKMVEWDLKNKILSNNERQYLSDFAYGLKKLNNANENFIRRYHQRLKEAGF